MGIIPTHTFEIKIPEGDQELFAGGIDPSNTQIPLKFTITETNPTIIPALLANNNDGKLGMTRAVLEDMLNMMEEVEAENDLAANDFALTSIRGRSIRDDDELDNATWYSRLFAHKTSMHIYFTVQFIAVLAVPVM